MQNLNKSSQACVLFSGGSDSSLTAYLSAQEFVKVHLLTYKQFGQLNIENSKISFNVLDQKMPGKFIHEIIDISNMFLKIYNRNYLRNLFKYKTLQMQFPCFACQSCFHINTIIYCKKNTITEVRDGANTEYEEASPMQIEIVRKEIKGLYREYGINHASPVYHEYETNRSDFQLYKLGLRPKPNIKDDRDLYRAYQGYCRFMPGSTLFLEYWKKCNGFPTKVQQGILKHWLEEVDFLRGLIDANI